MQRKNAIKIKNRQNFSLRFRNLRKQLQLSQRDLAEKIGLTGNTQICKFEKGTSEPSLEVLRKMAKLFNIDIHKLVTGESASSILALANCLKPCAESYLTDLTEQIKKLNNERVRLDLSQIFKGKNNQARLKDLESEVTRLEKEYELISSTLTEVLKPSCT